MPALTSDVIEGRKIDLLGRVQGVALGSASSGVQTTIFTTNNKDFPGQTIFIAYVSVDLLTRTQTANGYTWAVASGTFDANLSIDLGSSGGSDWGQGTIGLGGLTSPAVLYNSMEGSGTINLTSYGIGIPFTVVNRSSGASSQIGQVSAWGWAFG